MRPKSHDCGTPARSPRAPTTPGSRSVAASANTAAMNATVPGHSPASRPRTRSIAMTARRSEEHTSELQSLRHLVCRLLLEKKKSKDNEVNCSAESDARARRGEGRAQRQNQANRTLYMCEHMIERETQSDNEAAVERTYCAE